MTDLFTGLYKKRIFTLDEAVKLSGSSSSNVANSLLRWQRQGYLKKIRRNLYCVVDLASGALLSSEYEIASHITPTSYVAYHSALAFHGLAHQQSYVVSVGSDTRFRNFQTDLQSYVFCKNPISHKGIFSPNGYPLVRVTDLERTFVDCMHNPDKAGGVDELMHCLEGITYLDEKKISAYLKEYNNQSLYKKVGYILEWLALKSINQDFIEECRHKSQGVISYLDKNETDSTFVNRWSLIVPSYIINYWDF